MQGPGQYPRLHAIRTGADGTHLLSNKRYNVNVLQNDIKPLEEIKQPSITEKMGKVFYDR